MSFPKSPSCVYRGDESRLIQSSDAKWVTDDYYEDEALAKCAENGFTPYAPAHEEEIAANAAAAMGLITRGGGAIGERERDAMTFAAKSNAISPFYTIGGPTTHFGGTGIDPWSEGGWGNRRAKLRGIGVTEDDWMYRTAVDCRAFDATLRQYREERIGTLEGDDLRGWVWTHENNPDEHETNGEMEVVGNADTATATALGGGGSNSLRPPIERKRSALSREVTFEPEVPTATATSTEDALTPLPLPSDDEGEGGMDGPNGTAINGEGEVRVETAEDVAAHKRKWAYGTGSWAPGTIRAAYEVCLSSHSSLDMPHLIAS